MKKREIQLTNDGSHTIAIPDFGITYHSHHGAIQESMHVFIDAGLQPFLTAITEPIRILEIGFGTGLNALLTLREAINHHHAITYISTEKFPLTHEEVDHLNHGSITGMQALFLQLHGAEWELPMVIHPLFTLEKKHLSLPAKMNIEAVHCIYFDAFAPDVQPELWSQEMFADMHNYLLPGGSLVTYCSKSDIRRAMTAAGFNVEKIPGPYGKREMVRAIK